jgi:threonine dehydratase
MGLEVLDQVPDLDAIVVPVGGGGLIAGDFSKVYLISVYKKHKK